jgi:hypothetical protein
MNQGLSLGKVTFPLNSLGIHRARPNDALSEEMDYVINANGKLVGCGVYPTGNVSGVSTFGWASTDLFVIQRMVLLQNFSFNILVQYYSLFPIP